MNKIRALIIPPTGDMEIREIEDDYKVLQSLVGGYIEGTWIEWEGHQYDCVVNEEGLLQKLTPNYRASLMHTSGFIVGTMVVMGEPDDSGEYTSIPLEVAEDLKARLENPSILNL